MAAGTTGSAPEPVQRSLITCPVAVRLIGAHGDVTQRLQRASRPRLRAFRQRPRPKRQAKTVENPGGRTRVNPAARSFRSLQELGQAGRPGYGPYLAAHAV